MRGLGDEETWGRGDLVTGELETRRLGDDSVSVNERRNVYIGKFKSDQLLLLYL